MFCQITYKAISRVKNPLCCLFRHSSVSGSKYRAFRWSNRAFRGTESAATMESQLQEVRGGGPGVLDKDASKTVEGGVQDIFGEDSATENQSMTPWMRCVASGVELLRDPRFNKGLAFTKEERNRHYLRGLLPPAELDQELQLERLMENIRGYANPLQKYVAMMDTQDRNERLFYAALVRHVEELMPVVYTPTVGEACQKYGAIFHRPRGLYISIKDKGDLLEILKNWPERNVGVIVVTDGERILGLGDLGLQGMGIPVGKLALYTALGGVRPSSCLPISLDVGTNNQELLDNKYYIGLRQKRATGQEYDDFIDEFMQAVKQAYGEKVLVQFEDFGNHNAFRLLAKYQTTHLTFNDDIQGTASVALAGLLASMPMTGKKLSEHSFVFLGAGEAGTGIAEIIATYMSREDKTSLEEARKSIWLVDSKGLVTASRKDSLASFKKPFAHEHEERPDLISTVASIKPSVIIGTSAQAGFFTKEVLQEMAKNHERPVVFALSNPTSKAECTAEDAYKHTKGTAIFASGSPFDPVDVDGKKIYSGQANNAYIFPGIGQGVIVADSVRIHDDMFLAAAEALAAQVTDEHRAKGLVFPPFEGIREISARIAAAVATKAYDLGLATRQPRPKDLLLYTKRCMYSPMYRSIR
eukprot:jgi/Mesen1/9367/ME000061S08810